MVLTIPQPRSRWQGESEPDEQGDTPGPRTWAAERGGNCWTAAGDVAGAFPGFARQGGLLANCRMRITERYLLVDEGRAHGFGLPLAACQAMTVVVSNDKCGKPKHLLQVTYQDGQFARNFVLRPRTERFGWSRDRFADALTALHRAGHDPDMAATMPSLLIGWDDARRYRHENVIWSGRVTAPVDCFGLARASCDLWLTTRSLMWSSASEQGINRLPLEQTIDILPVELADQAATPALVLGYQDDQQCRRELVFIFDRHSPADRNGRERGAIVVAFRSRGVPDGAETVLHQPWRRDWWCAPAVSVPVPETVAREDTTLTNALDDPPNAPTAALAQARACEADALLLLARLNAAAHDGSSDHDLPTDAVGLGNALAEIETAETTGALSSDEAAARRAHLLALAEASSRLRALLRLRHSDQISAKQLEARRRALVLPLNQLIPGSEAAEPGPAS